MQWFRRNIVPEWVGGTESDQAQPQNDSGLPDEPPIGLTQRVEEILGSDLGHNEMGPDEAKLQIPTVFHWAHGGRRVYLVTSLDDWETKHKMNKSHQDFSKILSLPTGRKIQYRFEVDGRLLCDPEQKHVRGSDGGYVNEIFVESTSHESFITQNISSGKFTQSIPDPDEYVREPPHAPAHLGHIILNTLPPKGSNPLRLPAPSHVVLGHIFLAERKDRDVVVLGMTQRFQSKSFTTVYYKHVDKHEATQPPTLQPSSKATSTRQRPTNWMGNFL